MAALLFSGFLYGQEQVQDSTVRDSVKTGVALGELKLPNPDSVISKYTYDPTIDRYVYTEQVGGYSVNYPLFLTPDQYYELVRRESIKGYFKEKIDAFSGKKEGAEEARRNLLPNFYVNSNFFETIFGGNTIEVIPQGSVAMDLGVLWQKNDNPSLSPRNRSNLSLDFDQRIQLSLLGKVGERLEVSAQYDTEATFDFQNLIKLEYKPTEDDILQNIEIGNVNMPLSGALISGAQSLFGVKTELQFGRTRVTAVFSEQQSQNNSVVAQGGGTIDDFLLTAMDYDEDRHFFLSQYFRDNYDRALESYPFVQSQVQITRLEVWVTNRSQQTLNVRNVVAIQDLGETRAERTRIGRAGGAPAGFFNPESASGLPQNGANDYDPVRIGADGVLTAGIRDIATVENAFNIPGGYVANQGFDYTFLENAQKLEPGRDYQFDSQLGYISLNQRLSNDEVLAVAFQYTFNGQVYQVGEFANGSIEATSVSAGAQAPVVENNTLILKLLKSNITNVDDPIWDLMMKNIYSTGAFQLSQEDFKLNILYSDPSPRNYITPVDPAQGWPDGLQDRILINVFNFDRLNVYNDVQEGGDGFFDFIPGRTVETQSGRIIFTKVEPFGEYLFELLRNDASEVYDVENDQGYNPNQEKYVFRDLYAKTKAASLEDAAKNRFQIKGRYKSQGQSGIPIGAFNVPRGSVRVTAGGRQLQEGVDYTVNYQGGTVQLLDPSLEASNVPINISVENNAVFGQQTRRFTGVNVEHTFNENFVINGTLINLNERPLTQKANFGVEPVNNTVFGLNGIFSTELPFLTRLANKLPNIDTDAPSNLSLRGEVALLSPNSPKNADFNGETTSYLDDFEGAQALIDVRGFLGWTLASPPLEFFPGNSLPGSTPDDPLNLTSGYGRAKMAWYTIDPIFYTNQRPSGLTDNDVSLNETRRVFIDEVFPTVDIAQGQTTVQGTLDLAYYPERKGPYNNNPGFDGLSPEQKWGGIMRPLSSTNFEQSNVEFVQFWVLDPYVDGIATDAGELVINLGNISEDILKDGRKQYENGLPATDGDVLVSPTSWGQVPSSQSLVYAFDANEANRSLQDLGLDGLSDEAEAAVYNNPGDDPALDNYTYYLAREGGILERYLDFNNPEGNSPVSVTNTDRGSTTLPDVEDIDRDLTMNTVNSYYEYRIPIKPNTTIDDQYVTDIREGVTPTLANGQQLNRRWIQYKIPLSDFTDAVGGIADFRSISFMRMYLTGFNSDVVLRFATLDLVRGDWRTYLSTLQTNEDDPADDLTTVDVNTVNIEENSGRIPIPYVLPPGVVREQLNNNNTIIRQNEQSLSFLLEDLEPQDSRGVFKNINIDVRQYERIRMFMHAEEVLESDYGGGETPLVGFLRIGTDFSENFYQIELPLEFTPFTARSPREIWPEVNEINLDLDQLNLIKSRGIEQGTLSDLTYYEFVDGQLIEVSENTPHTVGRQRIAIKGNPSLGSLRAMMVGVKNTDNLPARGEVWFNELRLAGLDNQGGWAATAALDANMADFMNVTATMNRSTSGFGSIDQIPNERAREDTRTYDVVTNVNVGQLLPGKWGIQLPVNYGFSETLITPEFDPVYDDLKLEDRISQAATPADADRVREQAEDYTKRRSFNLIGVRKDRSADAKPNFFDVENFTFNYSYNETNHRDFEIAELREQRINAGVVYAHEFQPLEVAPFAKNDSILSGRYWQWLKELNFNLLPTSISMNADINRTFNQQRFREVFEPGVETLALPTLQQRNYLFNWQYAVNYNITKSLRANLTASNNSIVRNYFNADGDDRSGINSDLNIWDGFFDVGEPNRHSQILQVNYDLPLDKFPFLNFMTAQYTYNSNFDWQRGGDALREVAGEDINTVQNASTHNMVVNMTLQGLYDYLGLVKRDGTEPPARSGPLTPVSDGDEEEEKKPKKTSKAFNTLVDILTMVKRGTVNYTESRGTVLPGYTRSVGFIGTSKPTLGFVFGSQADVRFDAARRGFLTTFPEFNSQFMQNLSRQLSITATAQPTPDLTIDLVADRQFATNLLENFRVEQLADDNFEYVQLLTNNSGNFSISNIMIATAFSQSDEFNSTTFEQFKENRLTIANRLLASQPGLDTGNRDADGFPERFGKTQQDVLLPAFVAAYTGQSAENVNLGAFRNIPLPNWTIKWTGLMKNKWFKERFRRFSIQHGYRSAYSINNFQTNLEKQNGLFEPETGNIRPDDIISNVVLNDQFNPLIRLDFEMENSLSVLAEVRTDRALSLSFDNNLLTEVNGREYTLGLGYRIKDVRFVTNIGGEQTRLKGDLNLKADISLRDNETIIRNLDIDNNQITSGQQLWGINFTADYALSQSLNALFFYDHSFSQFKVSTAFPQTSINAGFTLRYNFGN